jgi:hypothetical protein
MSKQGKKHLTEFEFDNLKLMQAAKLRMAQVVKITGRSHATISRVFANDTFKGYKELTRRKKEVTLPKLTAGVRPLEDTELIVSKLTTIETLLNQLLEVIQDKESKANAAFWRR